MKAWQPEGHGRVMIKKEKVKKADVKYFEAAEIN